MTPEELQAMMAQRALGGMQANPTGFNPAMQAANAPMPNPNMGGGFLGKLRQGAVGFNNALGRAGQGMFQLDPNAAKHMSPEQIGGMRNQAMMEMGLGMMAAGSKPGATLGGSLAEGYFGAQQGMLGRQQMSYKLGAQEREEERDESRYQTGLGREQRLDAFKRDDEMFDRGHADRTYTAGRNDEQWMRGYRNRELASMDQYRKRQDASAFEQAGPLTPEAIDMVAQATLRNPQLMNNYLSRSGMGNQKNRNLVTERQVQILKEHNTNPARIASIQANVKAHGQAISQNQKAVSSLQAFEAVVKNNGARLKTLFAKIPDTGVPIGNALARGAKYNLGDADVAEMRQVMQNFQAETARIVAGHPQLLGNVTDSARTEIEQVVSGNMTVEQANRVIDRLMFESGVREQGFMESMQESSRSIDQLGTPGQSFLPQGGPLGQPGAPRPPMLGAGGNAGEKIVDWSSL